MGTPVFGNKALAEDKIIIVGYFQTNFSQWLIKVDTKSNLSLVSHISYTFLLEQFLI